MKLYVGNLSYHTTDSDLESLFSAHGEVAEAHVIIDRDSGRSRGFGFVEMPNDDEARAAIEACDQMQFMGRTITVNQARPQGERSQRPARGGYGNSGGGRGGYRRY
ncbi:MAG: RNA-binding protein [Chlorobi bacterium]|nr:RNA-binding protein [Chlorobiota bacterium]